MTTTPAPADRAANRPGRDHPYSVTVRTLAGHSLHEQVRGSETVAELTAEAVAKFVRRGELTSGNYTLTLPRLGDSAGLDPTGSLSDVGVVAHDVLVLVSRDPQVDG